jgi:hypothetical protein
MECDVFKRNTPVVMDGDVLYIEYRLFVFVMVMWVHRFDFALLR